LPQNDYIDDGGKVTGDYRSAEKCGALPPMEDELHYKKT
jgi:hypothetical protein